MTSAKAAPEKGLRERKKEQTRAAIAHTAIGLFLERGFDHVSIAEIAAAAGVAKMTVTNYFPAKEDLVLSADPMVTPDLAGAVRNRPPDASPVAALRRFVRAELDRRAEWTLLHDGVTVFARMSLASPALTEACARRWDAARADLARAFEEASARPVDAGGPPGDAAGLPGGAVSLPGGPAGEVVSLLLAGQASPEELARLAGAMTLPWMRAQVAAGQVAATLQALTLANLVRQAAGLSADETAAQSHAETTAAFEMLESGLGRLYG